MLIKHCIAPLSSGRFSLALLLLLIQQFKEQCMTAVSTDCKKCHFTMVGVRSSALLMVFVSTLSLCLDPATVSAADVEVDLFGKLAILL